MNILKSLFFSLLIALSYTYFVNSDIFASGVMLDSIGAVSSGRGGTNIGHIDNGELVHDNPAALVNMPAGKSMSSSLEFIYPEIRFEDPENIDHSKHEIITLPTFSFTYKKDEDSRFAFGAGAYTTAGFRTEYHLEHNVGIKTPFPRDIPLSFGNQLYRSETSFFKTLFASSYKVNEKLSLGASFGPTFHKAELEAPFTLQTGKYAGILSFLTDVDLKDNTSFSYSLGAQYKITKNTIIGFSFLSESKATLRGDADMIVPGNVPGVRLLSSPRAEYDTKVNLEWPRSIGAGIAHQLGSSHKFSMDIVWTDWDAAYDRFDFQFTKGDNKTFNKLLGPNVDDIIPLDWESAFSFRFGYEYFMKGEKNDIFRFGYIYDGNPVPDDTLTPLIPGVVKHIFSLGYSHKWKNLRTDIAAKFDLADEQSVAKSNLIGGDYDNSTVKPKGYFLFMGITYNF